MYYSGPLYWKVVSYRVPLHSAPVNVVQSLTKPISRSEKPSFQIYNDDEINQFINDISQKCSIVPSTPAITNVDNLIVNAPIKLDIPVHEKENINIEGCRKNLNSDCFSELSEDDNSLNDLDNIDESLYREIDFGPPILLNCKGKPFQRRTIQLK